MEKKYKEREYIALDTELGTVSSTSRKRTTSRSFQNNFEAFQSSIENGDMHHLKVLFDVYPEDEFEILSCRNEFGQSILHLIAVSSSAPDRRRVEIADIIYNRLAQAEEDLKKIFRNCTDSAKNSPLHYAAKYKRKNLLYWYINKDLFDGFFDENEDGMTPFHFIVSARSKEFIPLAQNLWGKTAKVDGRFKFTKFSPLHIASKDGILEMVRFLVEKAKYSTEECNTDIHSEDYGLFPLHYAIKYSDNTSLAKLKYLLEKTTSKSYRTKNTGDTPIHIAAKFGKPTALLYLFGIDDMTRSTVVNTDSNIENITYLNFDKKDLRKSFFAPAILNSENQTCLHVIPNICFPERAIVCVRIILHQNYMTYGRNREEFCMKKDKNGKTAIEYAADYETLEVCREILTIVKCDPASKWLKHDMLSLIYSKVPDALIPVFENCLKKSTVISRRQRFIIGDIAPILGERKYNHEYSIGKPESYYLHKINSVNRKIRNKVLRVSLVEQFIQRKFNLISNFLLAGCLFQLLYIIIYTLLAYITFNNCQQQYIATNATNGNYTLETYNCRNTSSLIFVLGAVVLLSSIMLLTKEFYQLIRSKTWQSHFKKQSNWAQLIFTVITGITTISFLTANRHISPHFQALRILTVCGVLLGGVLSLYEFKKVSKFGEFSRIFWKVVKKSALLFAYYAMLMVAFMVSFRILTPDQSDFMLPFGLVKVITMMVGEYEFDGSFESGHISLNGLIIGKLFVFGLFIFVAAIVGLNLLIGLAVEDIQTLKADAKTEMLAMQLEHIYMTEKFFQSIRPLIGEKLFNKILDRTNLVVNTKNEHSRRYYFTTFEFPVPSDEELKI